MVETCGGALQEVRHMIEKNSVAEPVTSHEADKQYIAELQKRLEELTEELSNCKRDYYAVYPYKNAYELLVKELRK